MKKPTTPKVKKTPKIACKSCMVLTKEVARLRKLFGKKNALRVGVHFIVDGTAGRIDFFDGTNAMGHDEEGFGWTWTLAEWNSALKAGKLVILPDIIPPSGVGA